MDLIFWDIGDDNYEVDAYSVVEIVCKLIINIFHEHAGLADTRVTDE